MNQLLILFLISLMLSSCASTQRDYPADFYVQYHSKGALTQHEINVEINKNRMKLYFSSRQPSRSINKSHTITDAEASDLYNYLNSVDFHSIKSPEKEKMLDMPQEHIRATYDGNKNDIDLTSVRNIPDNIRKVRERIMMLVDKYDKNFRTEAGL